MTRLFKRKDKTTIAELEEYYQSQGQKRNKGLVAWIYLIATILIVIILIIGVFLLGRWIYRELSNDNSSPINNGNVEEINEVDLPTFDGSIVGQGNQANDQNTEVESGGVVSDQAATTDNSDAQTAGSSTSNSVPVSGDIPDTGAGEMLVLIPVSAGFIGYYISRKYHLKNN